MSSDAPAERVLKDIRRAPCKHCSAEYKIRIELDGLRGEDSISELCRRCDLKNEAQIYHKILKYSLIPFRLTRDPYAVQAGRGKWEVHRKIMDLRPR